MKAVGLGAAAIAAPGLVAGCSSSGSGGSATRIVFEETKPEVVPYFNNLVAKFNASQSHVVVTHDFTSSLIAEFVRGNPPAIDCDNYNLTTSIFVARGVLADLAHLPQAKTIDPNIQALVNQYASFHGETNVLPYSVAAEGVIYNADLFDKVGVSAVPTTWSEFLAVCEKFKSKNITPIYQTYGDTWTTQQGLFDYTAGGMIDVAAFYQQLAREATNLGPNSSVSFEKDFTAPCKQMLSLAPYFNENPIAKHYADGNLAFASGQAGHVHAGAVGRRPGPRDQAEAQDGHLRPARHRRRVPDQVPGQPRPGRLAAAIASGRAAHGGHPVPRLPHAAERHECVQPGQSRVLPAQERSAADESARLRPPAVRQLRPASTRAREHTCRSRSRSGTTSRK